MNILEYLYYCLQFGNYKPGNVSNLRFKCTYDSCVCVYKEIII